MQIDIKRVSTLKLFFDLTNSKAIPIKTMNISVSGFMAEIEDKDIQSIILISKFAQRDNSSMKAEVITNNGNLFHFQWIEGNEQDRVNWLKEISYYKGDELDSLSLKEEELIKYVLSIRISKS